MSFLKDPIVQEVLKAEHRLLGVDKGRVLRQSQQEMPCVVADRNLTIPGCRLSECRLLGVGFSDGSEDGIDSGDQRT